MEPQRTFLPERHGDLGDVRAHSVEVSASPHAPAEPWARLTLTPRQRDVAVLLAETGLSYKEIAARLDLSEGTVRTHTARIYRAFGVHSRLELIAALRRRGTDLPSTPQA